jgi:hypothetical protein
VTDYGIFYEKEACSLHNTAQLWSDSTSVTPNRRVYVCRATYFQTCNNQMIVDGLAALPAKMYRYAPDVLCVTESCEVRLIENINVGAGLVNSATGTVRKVVYNNADVQSLLEGKNPVPYCIIVEFKQFCGFMKTAESNCERVFPFPRHPYCVPVYRKKFSISVKDLPVWIRKKQLTKDCYRMQFPLDLSQNITVHTAQGQTIRNSSVSVDLGLHNPDRSLPSDIASILYVACTRVEHLEYLFVSSIYPGLWEKIGKGKLDEHRREVESKLKEESLKFAAKHGKLKEMEAELQWTSDNTGSQAEWKALQNTSQPPARSFQRHSATLANDDFKAVVGDRIFSLCLTPVQSERHIGLDQGKKNFGMAVVETTVDHFKKLVAAENYTDLGLPEKFTASNVLIALTQKTDLMRWMQPSNDYSHVDRVIVHLEQLSRKNKHWKPFSVELGRLLQMQALDVTKCIVKMSQPHIHRVNGPIYQLGHRLLQALKLERLSESACDDVVNQSMETRGIEQQRNATCPDIEPPDISRSCENDMEQIETSYSQSDTMNVQPIHARDIQRQLAEVKWDDVEPSDNSSSVESHTKPMERSSSDDSDEEATVDVTGQYRKKKELSSELFRYVVNADHEQQTEMGIAVDSDLQQYWKDKMQFKKPGEHLKLDDVGDAVLHAMDELLTGSNQFRQLVPRLQSIRNNRTICLCVLPNVTYWAVIRCSMNVFVLENIDKYTNTLTSFTYSNDGVVSFIKSSVDDELKKALCEFNGSPIYSPQDFIKIVVKQITARKSFDLDRKAAGALTEAASKAMRAICDEVVGLNSILVDRRDKTLGSIYMRTDKTTGQK